jgi:hypothetical protein
VSLDAGSQRKIGMQLPPVAGGQPGFDDPRRERLFLSSVAFFSAFALARAITHALRPKPRRLQGILRRPQRHRHHHLVAGILLLLGDGYLWLAQLGTGGSRASRWGSRVTSMLYGVGSALTLDEFALWLNLEDDYWRGEGRKSIDAVVLFGALLSATLLGGPLVRRATRR